MLFVCLLLTENQKMYYNWPISYPDSTVSSVSSGHHQVRLWRNGIKSNFLIGCSCNKNGSGSDRNTRFLVFKIPFPQSGETVDSGY